MSRSTQPPGPSGREPARANATQPLAASRVSCWAPTATKPAARSEPTRSGMRTRLPRMDPRRQRGIVRPPAIVSSAYSRRYPVNRVSKVESGICQLRSETLEQASKAGADARWRHPEFATDLGRIEARDVAQGEEGP